MNAAISLIAQTLFEIFRHISYIIFSLIYRKCHYGIISQFITFPLLVHLHSYNIFIQRCILKSSIIEVIVFSFTTKMSEMKYRYLYLSTKKQVHFLSVYVYNLMLILILRTRNINVIKILKLFANIDSSRILYLIKVPRIQYNMNNPHTSLLK